MKQYWQDNYFEVINNEEKAYWLGFIYADGCVYEDKSSKSLRLRFSLQSSDEEIILNFRKSINSNRNIQMKEESSTIIMGKKCLQHKFWRITINSNIFCKHLINKGVIQRKSLTIKFPSHEQLPKELIPHFIRGYFDGDGSVFVSKEKHWRNKTIRDVIHCRIMGTFDVLSNICKEVEINPCLIKTEKKFNENTFDLRLRYNVKCKKLYFYMYNNASIFLERKFLRFQKYLKFKGSETIISHPVRMKG